MPSRQHPSDNTAPNGNSKQSSPFAGEHGRAGYNPYDARHYDSGGFGYGGSSGSAGGFGVGGNGPQTGNYGSQANYGQGNGGADFNPGAGDSRYPESPPQQNWTDAFPHDWRGWGPLTPDEPASPARRQRRHLFDDQYLSWREEQMRKLDEDYHAYRQEHQGRFNEDFNAWREKRPREVTGSANDVSRPPGETKPDPKQS